MGAESDASWIIDKSGQEAAYCFLGATLRDFGRLGMLPANGGVANGKQIVHEEWVREATQPTPGYPHLNPGVATPYMGYGTDFGCSPKATTGLPSWERADRIFVEPELKFVMVQIAVWKSFLHPESGRERDALWRDIVATYGRW